MALGVSDMSSGTQLSSSEVGYVLFMDIVGYSLELIERQSEILHGLQKIVRESTDFQRASTQGMLIPLPTGDGMVLLFLHDPSAPVKCALEIARALKDHPEIKLRMGIHVGALHRHLDIKEELNAVGGGINLAQRVMDCGDPGHILLSSNIVDFLKDSRDWVGCFGDLGVHKVKHGVKVHLYNLCKDGLGNPTRPQKLRRKFHENLLRMLVAALIVGICAVLWWNYNLSKQLSKRVASKAMEILDRNPQLNDVALQLARAALSKAPTPEGREALFRAALAAGRIQTGLGSCTRIAFSNHGDRLATAGQDGVVKVWNLSDRTEARSVIQFKGGAEIRAIAFNDDGTRLAVAGSRGHAEVWDSRSAAAKPLRELAAHDETIMDVAFCPKRDDGCLATASFDGTVRLWESMSGRLTKELPAPHVGLVKIAFTRDGSRLAIIAKDGDTTVWDIRADKILAHFSALSAQKVDGSPQQTDDSLASISFSPDGTLLATASESGHVKFWEPGGHFVKESQWPGAVFRVIAFQPNNDRRLVTVDADGRAIMWNLDGTPSPLWLPRDSGRVRDAAFSPNGECLGLAEDNGDVLLYYMSDPELEKYEKSIVSRDLRDDECRGYLGLRDCRELR